MRRAHPALRAAGWCVSGTLTAHRAAARPDNTPIAAGAVAQVQACSREEVDAAYAAAKAAQKGWARTPLWQRAAVLHKAADLMRQHAQPMADCLVKEIAKPAKDALTEVMR